VTPAPIIPTILEDPDDDHVLAAAVSARVDLIVSGDRHLLGLAEFQGCRIVNAATALSRLSFEA
ncbi:MAG: putative toxin-antitoxin system toxin component, PIN family, partial [Gemmataceae bacterium]